MIWRAGSSAAYCRVACPTLTPDRDDVAPDDDDVSSESAGCTSRCRQRGAPLYKYVDDYAGRVPHLGLSKYSEASITRREPLNKNENERSGVLWRAMSFLGLYRDPVVAAVTQRCDWRTRDLVEAERPTTLYLVVPRCSCSTSSSLIA
jgi:hypothetical protein